MLKRSGSLGMRLESIMDDVIGTEKRDHLALDSVCIQVFLVPIIIIMVTVLLQ